MELPWDEKEIQDITGNRNIRFKVVESESEIFNTILQFVWIRWIGKNLAEITITKNMDCTNLIILSRFEMGLLLTTFEALLDRKDN